MEAVLIVIFTHITVNHSIRNFGTMEKWQKKIFFFHRTIVSTDIMITINDRLLCKSLNLLASISVLNGHIHEMYSKKCEEKNTSNHHIEKL